MTAWERRRYHQLHPAKLLVDWSTAILAGALLWRRQAVTALVVGFGPSIVVTLVFLSGRLDRTLDRIRSRPTSRRVGSQLSAGVNAVRFAGLALCWSGCWLRRPWLVPTGVLLIFAGWSFAWKRHRRSPIARLGIIRYAHQRLSNAIIRKG